MKKFIRELFEDDTQQICMGRFSLFLGLLLTPITAVWSMDTVGEVTLWEAVVRCSPGLIGLIAYVFTRLAEMKEWLAETAEKVVKKNKK
jgi:hypothetical protein